jgi:hypothetical protein
MSVFRDIAFPSDESLFMKEFIVASIYMYQSVYWVNHGDMFDSNVYTQEVTTTYSGAGKNTQMETNDSTKKGLTNRSNTRTQSRNVELYHLDKWTTPLIEVQELYNFKKFPTKIRLESE